MVMPRSDAVRTHVSPDSSRQHGSLQLELVAPLPSVSGDLHGNAAADLRFATTTLRGAAELLLELWYLAMTTEDQELSERLAGASHALHHATRLLESDPTIG
jgi:hypothetical protein